MRGSPECNSPRDVLAAMVAILVAVGAGCGSANSRVGQGDGGTAGGGTAGVGGQAGTGGSVGSGGPTVAGGTLGAGGVAGTRSGGTSGSGGGTSATSAPPQVCRKAIEIQCARMAFLLGGTGLKKELNLQDCLRRADYCPDYYFAPDSNRTVENVTACLDALATRPLSDVAAGIFPPCLLDGKRADGQPCMWNSQCQSGECGGGIGECSTCSAKPGAGSPCPDLGLCRFGTFCYRGTELCVDSSTVVHASEGQPCGLGQSPPIDCEGDLLCVSSSSGSVCTAPPGVGQPCGNGAYSSGGFCAAGTDCTADANGSCAASGRCGALAACDAGSFCRSDSSGSTCVPRVAAGQPCYDSAQNRYSGCLSPATCNLVTDLCEIPRALGEACDAQHACGPSLLCIGKSCQPQSSVKCP